MQPNGLVFSRHASAFSYLQYIWMYFLNSDPEASNELWYELLKYSIDLNCLWYTLWAICAMRKNCACTILLIKYGTAYVLDYKMFHRDFCVTCNFFWLDFCNNPHKYVNWGIYTIQDYTVQCHSTSFHQHSQFYKYRLKSSGYNYTVIKKKI